MSQFDFSEAAPNTDKEVQGIWKTWSNGKHKIELLLARAGGSNTEFRIAAEEETRQYRRGFNDLAQLPPETQDAVNVKIYARHVVRDWKSTDFGGLNKENFSVDGVEYLFTKVPDTLLFVISESNQASNYANYQLERESKN